tara:strand:- start:77 stop:1003 length:927 start_codon:yes stop_codon:yes gene_type:complete
MFLATIKKIIKLLIIKLGEIGFKSKIKYYGLNILVPWNHPFFFWRFSKIYNRNLVRLAKQINQNYYIIDVGASIGDTYALLRGQKVFSKILLIEGGSKANYFLEKNAQNDENASIYNGLVGPNLEISYEESGQSGITFINNKKENLSFKKLKTLDEVIKNNISRESKVGLIKIDTDGFDSQIIRSGKEVLMEHKPILFFEAQPYHWLNNDHIEDFLNWINQISYKKAILWDNYGNFIMPTTTISNELKFSLSYFHGSPNSRFTDIALFHENDENIFESILTIEKKVYLNNLSSKVKEFPIKQLKNLLN